LAFRSLALRSLIAVAVGGVVGIGMALGGYGVWSLVARELVVAGVNVALLWRVGDWRPGRRVRRVYLRDLASFGTKVTGINVVTFFSRRADDFVIGRFLGGAALGYYDIAYRILLTMTRLLTGVTGQVTLPLLARVKEAPDRLRAGYYGVTQMTSLVALPAFTGAAVLAPHLVPLVFGSKWLPSVPAMQVLALVGILHSVHHFDAAVMVAVGRPGRQLAIGVLEATLNVVGFVLAVRWGIVAVAAAYAIVGYAVVPVRLALLRDLVGVQLGEYGRQLAVPAAASLLMALALLALDRAAGTTLPDTVFVPLATVAGAAVYAGALLLFAPGIVRQAVDLARVAAGGRG
jgi:PST family polysaccharide transporter